MIKVTLIREREMQGNSYVTVGHRPTVIATVDNVAEAEAAAARHAGLPAKAIDSEIINVGVPGDHTRYGARVESLYYEMRRV